MVLPSAAGLGSGMAWYRQQGKGTARYRRVESRKGEAKCCDPQQGSGAVGYCTAKAERDLVLQGLGIAWNCLVQYGKGRAWYGVARALRGCP